MNQQQEKLKSLENGKLMDVVKNYRQYGYDESLREEAIRLLKERGISLHDLELTGNLHNSNYDQAMDLYRSFSRYSMIALGLYGFVILLTFLLPLLISSQEGADTLLGFKTIATILYVIFLILSFLHQHRFYRSIGQNYGAEGALVYFFLGMPFYVLMYFYFRKQMREKLGEVR